MEEMLELGYAPRDLRNPTTAAEKAEKKLKKKITKHKLMERIHRELESWDLAASGGEHPAFQGLLEEVLELGYAPRELKDPTTDAEKAETKLRKKIKKRKLMERIERELESRGLPASGGLHLAANISQPQA